MSLLKGGYMSDVHSIFGDEFKEPEARHEYAEEFLNSFIALQIKTLRQQRGWSQEELAEHAGMKQSRISAMEKADYASWSVRTLRRLAQAFDLALTVRFESFGKFLDEATAVSRPALERPSFNADPAFHGKGEIRESAGESVATASFHMARIPNLRVASRG
jgi:transcriptional regulator with XRE-family HTH domain